MNVWFESQYYNSLCYVLIDHLIILQHEWDVVVHLPTYQPEKANADYTSVIMEDKI